MDTSGARTTVVGVGSSRRQKASFGCRAIGVLLLATAAFAAAVVLVPNQARSADGSTATFVDAVGDAGGAPDLSTAAVTEDATGTLSFVITASGFSAAPLPQASLGENRQPPSAFAHFFQRFHVALPARVRIVAD